MIRLRLFRILLPALLVLLGAVVVYNLNPRSTTHTVVPSVAGEMPRAEILTFKEWSGDQRNVAGNVALVQDSGDGELYLEGIRNLQIDRPEHGAIVVSATRGDRVGEEGDRVWNFTEEVTFEDPQAGLKLTLPVLEVDEAAGEARSEGEIRFEAPEVSGRAASLVYGLEGQPGKLSRLEVEDAHGGRLDAADAILWDGFRDVELIGDVRAVQPTNRLRAEHMRVRRDENDRVRHALCTGDVQGTWGPAVGSAAEMAADEVEVDWDADGLIEQLQMRGDAVLSRGVERLEAPTIVAVRRPGQELWDVSAEESVYVQGQFGQSPGLLRAERLEGVADQTMRLLSGQARGRVSFESADTRAEADRALYEANLTGGAIRLFGDGRRKARLANGQTRVAADEITTDSGGNNVSAEGRVEATMLSGAESGVRLSHGMFVADEAVHFVSLRLDSERAGQHLVFEGNVRGWQGERNLAADRLEVDQTARSLLAQGNVATRFPRQKGVAAVAQEDYVLVEAQTLTYLDSEGQALYEGDARLRFAEGWMEARRLEIVLDPLTSDISEVRAFEDIRLEVTEPGDGEVPRPTTGRADRLIYRPADATLSMIGDNQPATVRRVGEGVSSKGRLLIYRLDSGTIEVDSGGQSPASIRTSDG